MGVSEFLAELGDEIKSAVNIDDRLDERIIEEMGYNNIVCSDVMSHYSLNSLRKLHSHHLLAIFSVDTTAASLYKYVLRKRRRSLHRRNVRHDVLRIDLRHLAKYARHSIYPAGDLALTQKWADLSFSPSSAAVFTL